MRGISFIILLPLIRLRRFKSYRWPVRMSKNRSLVTQFLDPLLERLKKLFTEYCSYRREVGFQTECLYIKGS